jgi:ankyrin repeat protein
VVELLLEKGAELDARNQNQWIALHSAAHSESEAVIKLLLDKGADPNCQTDQNLGVLPLRSRGSYVESEFQFNRLAVTTG